VTTPDVPNPPAGAGPRMERMELTVLIAARNEEANIRDCIRSVAWADQIFLVDSQSTDRTCEIAAAEGAEVVQFHYTGGWPKKRNWALRTLPIRNAWVLLLDADERVTEDLRRDLAWALRQREYDGFYLKWRFVFLGRWMKHSWSHGWMLRLFRHGKGEYEDLGMRGEGGWDAEVHENVVVDGRCGRLKGLLDHDTNQGLSYWIRKQNEFSDWNAKRRLVQLREPLPPVSYLLTGDPGKMRKYLKALFIRLPARPSVIFFWLYVVKGGFLDGRAGFYFCKLRAMHELNICAKIYELQQAPPRNAQRAAVAAEPGAVERA
jgi:glycosyltransferase involved in cell wall biosynthesis